MKIDLPSPVDAVLCQLESNGYKAYVVGGCIRDSIMGKVPHDWDICTDARPEQVTAVFGSENIIPTGLKHGTVTVKKDGGLFEVTTFRTDGHYTDGRHPDNVTFVDDICVDLSRRDFTMNAIAYSKSEGLVDTFEGKADIDAGVIRAVGNPTTRFQEDSLRILRALRFSSVYGMYIEAYTYSAMARNLPLLDGIAKERIGTELRKTISGKYASFAMRLDNYRIVRYLIPELDATFGVEQHNRYHIYDVFTHTMKAFDNIRMCQAFPKEWADEYVRMAILLHDIGKPSCKTTDENGYDHFYGHAEQSAKLAHSFLKRMRFENSYIRTVVELIGAHSVEFVPTKKCARRLLRKYGVEQLHRLLFIRECDNRAHSKMAYPKFITNTIPFAKILQEVLDEESAVGLKDLALNGKDLIAEGYPTGPKMGQVLEALLDEVMSDTLKNEKGALLERAKLLYEMS